MLISLCFCVSHRTVTRAEEAHVTVLIVRPNVGCGEAVGRSISKPLRPPNHHHFIRRVNQLPRNPPDRAYNKHAHGMLISLCFCVSHRTVTRAEEAQVTVLIVCPNVGCGEAVGRSISKPLRPPNHHHLIRRVNHGPRNPPDLA